jgi:hypothetical protein
VIPFHPTPWTADSAGHVFSATGRFIGAFLSRIDAEFVCRAANRESQAFDIITALVDAPEDTNAWRRAGNLVSAVAARGGLDEA